MLFISLKLEKNVLNPGQVFCFVFIYKIQMNQEEIHLHTIFEVKSSTIQNIWSASAAPSQPYRQLLTQTGLVSETERAIQRIVAGGPGVGQGGRLGIVDGATGGHQLVQSVIVRLQCTHFIL